MLLLKEILAVVGGRDYKDKSRVFFEINEYRKTHNVIGIVSGVSKSDKKIKGADTWGRDYAVEKGLQYIGHVPDWSSTEEGQPCLIKSGPFGVYNALAALNRNTLIIEDTTTTVMAFWDGKSKGTLDSITKAKEMGKTVIIINY